MGNQPSSSQCRDSFLMSMLRRPVVYSRIGKLLEMDYLILEHTLRRVEKEDLCACRLVCRTWYETCRKLPIELHVSDVANSPVAANAFPGAISLCTKFCHGLSEAQIHQLSFHCNLRHLGLEIDSVCELPEVFRFSFLQLKRLKSLSLKFGPRVQYGILIPTLTSLTQLRSLHIDIGDDDGALVPSFRSLSKIRELSLTCSWFSRPDQMITFPSATKLKSLKLLSQTRLSFPDHPLMSAVQYYDKSLQQLSLPAEVLIEETSWKKLTSLHRLNSFICPALSTRQLLGCLSHLQKLKTLRTLEMSFCDIGDPVEASALEQITQLRSLTCTDVERDGGYVRDSELFKSLKRLTCLSFLHGDPGTSINYCTGLVRLEMSPSPGTLAEMNELKNLKQLRLHSCADVYELDAVLDRTPQLRLLELIERDRLTYGCTDGVRTQHRFTGCSEDHRRFHRKCPFLESINVAETNARNPYQATRAFRQSLENWKNCETLQEH